MSWAAEDRLLVLCSRVSVEDEAIGAASDLLRRDLDWDYVLQASILHGVAPLFRHGLAQVTRASDTAAAIPSGVQERLEQLYRNNRARNRRLYGVVGEMCEAFGRAGVQAMGLKDLLLTRTVYPDMGLRPLGDIDVLIRREDYERVEACLASLGFSPLPGPDCAYLLKYAWALHFHRPTDDVWVDVQWGVLQLEWDVYEEGNFDFEIDRMWRGGQVVAIDDYEILAPRPEDMLFHLCMHLEGHRYAELILFCDIAELIRQCGNTLDWDYLIGIAKKYGVEVSIYCVLSITRRLFGCPLPAGLEELSRYAHFKANLFAPLFGNLAALHVALDDAHRLASPPAEVMARFEAIVRRQAACAMRCYEALDGLATALNDLGAALAMFDGGASPMVFPSRALPPFSDVRLFVLERDRPRLRRALSACGFARDREGGVEPYTKRHAFESKDPATGDAPLIVEIRGQFVDDLDLLFHLDDQRPGSRRDLALKAARGALGREGDDPVVGVQLHLVVLTPEEMVAYLAARLGQRQHERLFGLCSLLEFFRGCRDAIDWQEVADVAGRRGLGRQICAGLSMANALLDRPVAAADLERFGGIDASPRMLQWARYGPAEMERYTGFKELFFHVFAFLSVDGLGPKLRYLMRAFPDLGRGGALWKMAAILPRLIADLAANAFRGKNRYAATDLAYWAKPEPVIEG